MKLVARFAVDDAELTALHARAFGSTPFPVRAWAAQLNAHALTWIGAFDGSQLTGFIQVAWDGGEHAFLLDTMVDPSRRRTGLGATLVAAATSAAREAGCRWLHVDYEPHLAAFYQQRCGFRPTPAALLDLTA